ncbi:MAG: chorismate synthase [Chloroflexi bacterium]|nr:chorismate synthase [Ardenticatenaceae bacterium]MBL1128394.1 chorismate synthase [Chloroflexota bacterium]NOG34471.1 chorismate synthase [Chloroflexota bacterium]GIK59023.1 MAG: chorismate synthase [Chloroflexota bacterium]
MEILGGPLFAVAGAGESHGPAITTIVFGCPPGLRLSRTAVQQYLDRRRPGSSRHGTPRNEKDKVVLLSGLYQDDHAALTAGPAIHLTVDNAEFQTTGYEEGFTTGEPISAMVLSAGTKSGHYAQFMGPTGAVRPGHTDLVKYHQSKGFVDVRGGGRSSYRSTISDVIGGSIARIYLQEAFGTVILSSISQVGPLQAGVRLGDTVAEWMRIHGRQTIPTDAIKQLQDRLTAAEIHSLDADFAHAAGELIKKTRIEGDSLGAAVEVVAVNVPALVGEPLYHSLKVRLMGALGGLHAVQSCEIGDGIQVVSRRGSENNDPIRRSGYQSNSHGGLIGGVTTGMPLVCRVGFKPTSTIHKPQQSVRKNLEEMAFELEAGRHDPCVGVRAGVTLESRLAIELLNAVLWRQSQHVNPQQFQLFT